MQQNQHDDSSEDRLPATSRRTPNDNTQLGKTPSPRAKDGDAKKRARDQYDSPWKEIIEIFFEPLAALLFPERPAPAPRLREAWRLR